MATADMKSHLSSERATPRWVPASRHLLWLFGWLTVAYYALNWIGMPEKSYQKFSNKVYTTFERNKEFSYTGADLLLFTAPFVVLALIGCAAIGLDKAYPTRTPAPKHRHGWLRRVYDSLWTQPLVVSGPFGMMTAIDIMGFGMVVFVTLWQFFKYTFDYFKLIDAGETGMDMDMDMEDSPKMSKQMQKFEYVSVMLGWVALVPFALLFVPVTRGSPILKLIDIPFEHAVKHHIWIGHWTMILVTAHGLSYGIYYGVMDEFYLFYKWQRTGIANLPGVIALVAGLCMWPTSLAFVRRRFFNTFFGVHQLYIVFFAFSSWHLGIDLTTFFLGGPLLFFIDRFLRFLQSKKAVQGVTARVLPSGLIELTLPMSPGLSYNPLSFMFLRVRKWSTLEWHPFSTASTPLDNTSRMCILIKPLGDWTEKLRKNIEESSAVPGGRCPFSMKLYAEGPYGHESNYFLRYKHLFLVAGGIGVTPFMAIVQDICYRHEMDQVGLPTTVDLIWCVRTTSELTAFKDLFFDPARIFHKYGSLDSDFRINVQIYLTAEKGGPEAVQLALSNSGMELQAKGAGLDGAAVTVGDGHGAMTGSLGPWPGADRGASGGNLWLMAGMIVATCIGMLSFMTLFRVYVYLPNTDTETYERELAMYIDVLLFLVALTIGVVIFGGAVVFGAALASRYSAKKSAGQNGVSGDRELHDVQGKACKDDIEEMGHVESLLERSAITVGRRPNFPELMTEIRQLHDNFGGAEVGVMVCGPEALAVTVADQCRSLNFNQLWTKSATQFHYHSVSFDL